MSYSVCYGPELSKRYPGKKRTRNRNTCGIVISVLVLCMMIYCLNTKKVKEFLIPGDADVTRFATKELLNDIKDGSGLTEAIATFCQNVVEGDIG